MRLNVLMILILFALAPVGCGYRMGGGPPLYAQIRTIAIPVFKNATFEPGIEIPVTSAIKEAFVRDGRWRVVDDPKTADAKIIGLVKTFGATPLSFSVSRVVTQYRVSVTVEMTLVERGTEKILWREGGIDGHAEYFLTSDIAQSRSSEDRAIREASGMLAEGTAARILDGL